ncbi:MAG: DEAD/DEAH box helicase [Flavobacteriales bacterium]|nr:DEAD/DEAH box helicase [Flavobacteriales bacterium]
MNYKLASPIQEQAIPHILSGKDVIAIAQTGTGKTAAFMLPVLHKIMENGHHSHTQALVIVPTRELALQIDQAVQGYSYFTGANSIAVYGGGDGNDFTREQQAIARGVDIIIATPGKLITHLNAGQLKLNKLRFLVLDEADRMLDMGFQPDLLRIISAINDDRQTLMFSATMPDAIARMAKMYMKDPVRVSIARAKPAAGVKQGAYVVNADQKLPLIADLLSDPARRDQIVVVFCSRKDGVTALYQKLKQARFNVARISSDLLQEEREEVLQNFRSRKLNVLVATDVISRGIDIDNIDLVVNYDVPRDADDYVHRVGRTARAAKMGEAITLIGTSEQRAFARIEELIEMEVEKLPVPAHLGPVPAYKGERGEKPVNRHKKSGFRRKR